MAGRRHSRDVDIVVVATTNDALAAVTQAAHRRRQARAGREAGGAHVAELDPLLASARAGGVLVRVGFNHRYHPALQKAHEIVDSGALGPLMFMRGRYGHGGRRGLRQGMARRSRRCPAAAS